MKKWAIAQKSKNKTTVNIIDSIKVIDSFSKKDIEAIKNGDRFVRVTKEELEENRVPVYSYMI